MDKDYHDQILLYGPDDQLLLRIDKVTGESELTSSLDTAAREFWAIMDKITRGGKHIYGVQGEDGRLIMEVDSIGRHIYHHFEDASTGYILSEIEARG